MNEEQPGSQTGRSAEEDRQALDEAASIAHALDMLNARMGRQFGPLSRPQRRMLRLLSADAPVRVGDLGERLGLTTAGTTRMLDKLESMGYAARSRSDRSDQRQVYVTLTATGASALHEAEEVFLERMRTLLHKSLRPEERATLARLLQALGNPDE